MKWVTFATAPDQITGEIWCQIIQQSGIDCRLRDANPSFLGISVLPVRLACPEQYEHEAASILADISHSPQPESGDEASED